MHSDHVPGPASADPGDVEDLREHAARLEAACLAFPPLARLLSDLERVQDTGDRQEPLGQTARALLRFLLTLPHHQSAIAAAAIGELMLALHDAQSGRRSTLLDPPEGPRVGHRSELNSLSWAKDLIGSAVEYVMEKRATSQKAAINIVRAELKRHDCEISAPKISNICEHRPKKGRDEKSPDFRPNITSDAKLTVVIEMAAKVLKRAPSGL